MMRPRFLFFVPLMILAFLAFIAVGGAVVMALWNWLLPSLFGLPVVTFWQALGLLALSRILFGGVRLSGRRHGMGGSWRQRMHGMPPEAREAIRARMRERYGFGGPTAGTQWQ
ncbi:MAG: hypothetical protein U0P30_04785 [Vicinamibacterales bacterium]